MGKLVLVTAAAGAFALSLPAYAAESPAPGRTPAKSPGSPGSTACHHVSFPVRTATGKGFVKGTLCSPKHARTLQILVHGYDYDRRYWDFPYKSQRYSYVKAANRRGYATLAIDRMGSGKSWHPNSAQVTLGSNARTLHEVVQQARHGKTGRKYRKYVLVGHSYGSVTTYTEAGRYRDVDALVATGAGPNVSPVTLALFGTGARPVALDPKFAGKHYDPGYVTVTEQARKLFYNPADTDPEVEKRDFRTR